MLIKAGDVRREIVKTSNGALMIEFCHSKRVPYSFLSIRSAYRTCFAFFEVRTVLVVHYSKRVFDVFRINRSAYRTCFASTIRVDQTKPNVTYPYGHGASSGVGTTSTRSLAHAIGRNTLSEHSFQLLCL